MDQRTFFFLSTLALAAPPALAGTLTGRVVDSSGSGVAGVDLDADNQGSGGDPTLFNDGTDANGFFTTTVPDGLYDIVFNPPPPPATTHLITTLPDVAVVGTVNLGTIVLTPGFSLSAAVRNAQGQGVGGVNLDVIDESGANIALANDTSNAFGAVLMAVPRGPFELRFDPSALPGTLAPRSFELDPFSDFALGVVTLPQGYLVSATLRRSNGTAISGADADAFLATTSAKLYTPADDSSATGLVDFVVPAGTYDFEFVAPFAEHLVGAQVLDRTVSATTNLGVMVLPAGVVLSGNVAGFDGAHHAGVDVDLTQSSNGAEVVLGTDDTDAAGNYQVIVPAGTFDVRFTPPYALPLASKIQAGVAIAGNKVQNGILPPLPFFTLTSTGAPGSGGLVPSIGASGGAPRLGNRGYALELSNARGGALVTLSYTPNVSSAPFTTRSRAQPFLKTIRCSGIPGAAGAGAASVWMPIASHPALAGVTLRARFFVSDPAAAGRTSWTRELDATLAL